MPLRPLRSLRFDSLCYSYLQPTAEDAKNAKEEGNHLTIPTCGDDRPERTCYTECAGQDRRPVGHRRSAARGSQPVPGLCSIARTIGARRMSLSGRRAYNEAAAYEIRVGGRLDARWSQRLGGLSVHPTPGGDTLLTGTVADQAALYGLLRRLRDLGLVLIAVRRLPPAPDTRDAPPAQG